MLTKKNALLMVIDVQGKLANIVQDSERTQLNIKRLIEGAKILDLPVIATEQVPEKIGGTIEQIKDSLGDLPILSKNSSSCYSDTEIKKAIRDTGRDQVIVCGIETHICVYQTTLQLLADGFKVYLVRDAVSSRSIENKEIAVQRMINEGAKLASTEMVLFELQQVATGDQFRMLSKLIK
jgi:nicotinamidase-related amidase